MSFFIGLFFHGPGIIENQLDRLVISFLLHFCFSHILNAHTHTKVHNTNEATHKEELISEIELKRMNKELEKEEKINTHKTEIDLVPKSIKGRERERDGGCGGGASRRHLFCIPLLSISESISAFE